MTGQLLAFGDQQSVEPRVLDLGFVLAEARSLLQRLIGECVRLTMILSPNLSRVKVDPSQINQMLINLVVNASDAMPQGGELTIETRDVELEADSAIGHRETSPGRYVLLAVTDTGCGMAPEVQSQIFEPFFSGKRGHPGLGLWVVGRELAEAFRVLHPNIRILFQSGYTDYIVVRHGILQTEVPFL
jgi:two-component system cell cycle sensor histidine kinase/response regulator CckA